MYKTTFSQNKSQSFYQKFLIGKRFLFFFFVVFFPLSLLIIFGLLSSEDKSDADWLGESVEVEEIIRKEYFVVQTGFKSQLNNVSFTELKEQKTACFERDCDKIKSMLAVYDTEVIEGEDIYNWTNEKKFDGVLLIPVEKADFRLKTLAVDDLYIWDKETDLSRYPLVWEDVVRIGEENVTSFEQKGFSSSDVTTYVAGGEVIPARAVARKFRSTGDYTFPFHKVKDLFFEADIASVTLESAISGSPEPCHGCTWFVGDEAFIEGLIYLGVDVISPGNHMGDGGKVAIGRTIEVLDEADILYTGFSIMNLDEASKPTFYEVNGFRVAFLGYDDVAWFHWAGESWGGVATVSQRYKNGTKELLREKLNKDIEEARKKADYIVVLASWGDREYVNWALDYQSEMGHALIDAGADLVIGTHQHWVSEIEFYKGKPIFYSLGNFVFDQTHTDPTRQGIFVKFYFFQKNLVSVKIIPHQSCGPQQSAVDNGSCDYFQPQILEENDPVYKEILNRMYEYSDI